MDFEAEQREIAARLDHALDDGETLRPTELVPILDAWAYCGYIRTDDVAVILRRLCVWIDGYGHHRQGWYLRGAYRGRQDWLDAVIETVQEIER